MTKRAYFFNNISKHPINIGELGVVLPKGVSNLFELNEDLEYEQIELSIKQGTLRAAMENKQCIPIPDPYAVASCSDVIIRKPLDIQVFPSRTKFTAVPEANEEVFDETDDVDLFKDEDVIPARELAANIQNPVNIIEKVEATVKQTNLPGKPIENQYMPKPIKDPAAQEKIRNDILMKYETCAGITADGKRCLRQAKKGKKFCGHHSRPTT